MDNYTKPSFYTRKPWKKGAVSSNLQSTNKPWKSEGR